MREELILKPRSSTRPPTAASTDGQGTTLLTLSVPSSSPQRTLDISKLSILDTGAFSDVCRDVRETDEKIRVEDRTLSSAGQSQFLKSRQSVVRGLPSRLNLDNHVLKNRALVVPNLRRDIKAGAPLTDKGCALIFDSESALVVPPEVLKKYSTLLDGLRDGALAEALRWNNFWVFPETEEQKRAIIDDRRRQAGAQQGGLPDHATPMPRHKFWEKPSSHSDCRRFQ